MAINYALASNGSTATASSAAAWSSAADAINGVRHTNNSWGSAGSGWESLNAPSSGAPEWLEVNFGTARTITEIVAYTLADSINYNTDPTASDTFTQFGIVDFKVQYWNGSAWVDIANVVGNNKVRYQVAFAAITTQRVRVLVTAVGPVTPKARIIELEAWDNRPEITTTTLPNGAEGHVYTWSLAATGGVGSLTWSLLSGSLPAGMSPLPASGSGPGGTPTVAGTFNITVQVTDSLGNSDTQALTLTILSRITTKWSEMGIVPRAGMIAWHHDDEIYAANGAIYDFSGNLRHLAQASTPPALQAGVLNGNRGWYFDGTRNPLVNSGGNVTVRHGFLLVAVDEATFANARGLLTGQTSGIALAGESGMTKFAEQSFATYLRREVSFTSGDRQAPMSAAFAVIEFTHTAGITIDGIQIGQNLADGTKKFKGWFIEQILYGDVKADPDRRLIYEYFAMRYRVWSRNAAGLDVFPFQPSWDNDMPSDKLVLSSTSVNGSRKARSKSPARTAHALTFETRRSEETDAARAFWNEKYPGTSFIYRDRAYSPAVDNEVLFVSPFGHKRSNYHDNTYGFQIEDD